MTDVFQEGHTMLGPIDNPPDIGGALFGEYHKRYEQKRDTVKNRIQEGLSDLLTLVMEKGLW